MNTQISCHDVMPYHITGIFGGHFNLAVGSFHSNVNEIFKFLFIQPQQSMALFSTLLNRKSLPIPAL